MNALWLKTEQARDLISLVADLLEDEPPTAPDEAELDLHRDSVDPTIVSAVDRALDLHAFLRRPIAHQRLPDRTLTT